MMLCLKGKVRNVFQTPPGTSRSGETFGGEYKVQLEGKNTLRNGEVRVELISLRVLCALRGETFYGKPESRTG